MLRPGVATLSKAEHGSVCQSPTTSGQCLQAGCRFFNSLDDRRPYAPPACAPSPYMRGHMAVAQHRSARRRPPAARACHAPQLHWHANTCSRTTLPPHARTSGGHATSPRRLAPTVDGHTSPLHKEALACGGRTPLHQTVDQTHHPEGRHPEGQHAALFRKPPPPPTPPSKNTSPSSKNRPLLRKTTASSENLTLRQTPPPQETPPSFESLTPLLRKLPPPPKTVPPPKTPPSSEVAPVLRTPPP